MDHHSKTHEVYEESDVKDTSILVFGYGILGFLIISAIATIIMKCAGII